MFETIEQGFCPETFDDSKDIGKQEGEKGAEQKSGAGQLGVSDKQPAERHADKINDKIKYF